MSSSDDKSKLRKQAANARASMDNKDQASREIFTQVHQLPEYRRAKVVLFYVHVRDEVRTDWILPQVLCEGNATVVVPFCVGDDLKLFRLQSMEQLARGAFGIQEPRIELREDPTFFVAPQEVEVTLVPGVAFDAQGGRLGHGRGYYDRLLSAFLPTRTKIGLAFDCQIVEQVPTDPHDVAMDAIVTESTGDTLYSRRTV